MRFYSFFRIFISMEKNYNKTYYEKNKERLLKYQSEYRKNNPDKKKEGRKRYYEENKEESLSKMKKYYEENKEKIKQYKKEWAEKNKERLKEKRNQNRERIKKVSNVRHKKRLNDDPIYALTLSIRKNILKAFRKRGFEKDNSTTQILGCTFEEFKKHLESYFEPWMNWNNRGKYNGEPNYGWDVDHVIPTSSAKTLEEVIKLNHHTNLKPLCSYINRDVKKNNIH